MRKIAVIGLGQFGSNLAARLTALGCQVLAIDQNEARVSRIRNSVDRAVILDARDYEALASVLTKDFDSAIVSLGESIEASVLCTLHLKKIGVPSIRAKAINEDHAEILKAVGADQVIFPERETALRVAAQILNPNLLDFVPLAEEYQVIEVMAPKAFHGHSLQELDIRKRFNVLIIAVKRRERDDFEFLPGPDFVIKPEDVLVALGTKTDLERMVG